MAKNNFNFQVKAGLDVRNFNKGVNKNGFNCLRKE